LSIRPRTERACRLTGQCPSRPRRQQGEAKRVKVFLVLFFKKEQALLFEKRSKNYPDYPLSSANLPER
jgi:hypothetical protein